MNIFKRTRIHLLCRLYGIKDYVIDGDAVDVYGDVNFFQSSKKLTKFPFKFGKVTGDFLCMDNKLTSLKNGPTHARSFYCSNNNLTSLEGCPKYISGVFSIGSNRIESFESFPDYISGGIYFGTVEDFDKTPIYQVWKLFKDKDKIELFNDYDIIRPGKVIILDRLNDFLKEIDKLPQRVFNNNKIKVEIKSVKGYKCI